MNPPTATTVLARLVAWAADDALLLSFPELAGIRAQAVEVLATARFEATVAAEPVADPPSVTRLRVLSRLVERYRRLPASTRADTRRALLDSVLCAAESVCRAPGSHDHPAREELTT